MNIQELKEKLHQGPVKFSYKKKDGSLRTATGTLKMDIIPDEHHPKEGTGFEAPDGVTRYYDLNSGGWRSFINENLVEG